ncbi:MAG: hypothetical protein QXP80_06570 [Zestosphaera sp.]
MRYVVIDNWEFCPTPWLLSEYAYVAELFGEAVIITNVSDEKMLHTLNNVARATELSLQDLLDIEGIPQERVIVLDPSAGEELSPRDVRRADVVVIGGIMGDHPPKGRTRELISAKTPNAVLRSLGKEQLTIAGSAYVLKKVSGGCDIRDIDLRFGLSIGLKILDADVITYLPYAFPYERGRPILPRRYLETVALRSVFFEGVEVDEACPDKSEEFEHITGSVRMLHIIEAKDS